MAEPEDMVERVTSAMEAAWANWNTGDGRGRLQADVPVRLLADAAIRGMREPTENMSLRGMDAFSCRIRAQNQAHPLVEGASDYARGLQAGREQHSTDELNVAYRAYIDAALPPEPVSR